MLYMNRIIILILLLLINVYSNHVCAQPRRLGEQRGRELREAHLSISLSLSLSPYIYIYIYIYIYVYTHREREREIDR